MEFADIWPDGQHLAMRSDGSDSFNLWVFPSGDSACGRRHRIQAPILPRWSPDGQSLSFYSLKSGDRDVFTMPVVVANGRS